MSTAADKPVRHILALSGGKDSSALAVFMKGDSIRIAYQFGMGVDRLWEDPA